ncbi:MAG TPA: murein biosynthesis integral membrane protein MurJ [Candidatus Binataceae bacterium]|nr:murein biosynthesis integral membrane protein MurJ [Candidatus Binataceae bacterium]
MAENIKSEADPAGPPAAKPTTPSRAGAGMVASGILLSRIAGLIRATIFAHFLGNSAAADAFQAGFRIPNFLQNLLGEGVLSASFIPVYSKMLGEGDDENGDLLAWTFGAILALATSILVAAGIVFAPYLIDVIAPGFSGDKRALTVTIVRILFPGTGMLVMSAWCLGVLNSHHRFFMSYASSVVWNAAIIAALLWFGPRRTQDGLAIDVAWGAVVGAVLQVLVQLPQTFELLRRIRIDFAAVSVPLRSVFRNLGPVVAGRGVGQMSAYIDNLLASLLPTGAVAALNYGQILYMLPVSLFGTSIAASELPTMARATGTSEEIGTTLRVRLNAGLRQISFLVVPSAVAFIALGDVICALIFQSGDFSHSDAIYVWAVIAGSGVGMLASTSARLYINAFYAMLDTRTPLKFAVLRVSLTLVLGYFCALIVPGMLGVASRWGVAGLTASAGVSSWIEFTLLRRRLNQRVGSTGLGRGYAAKLWGIAIVAAAIAFAIKLETAGMGPRLRGFIVLPAFGVIYLGTAWALGMPEFDSMLGMIRRRFTTSRES